MPRIRRTSVRLSIKAAINDKDSATVTDLCLLNLLLSFHVVGMDSSMSASCFNGSYMVVARLTGYVTCKVSFCDSRTRNHKCRK